MYSSDHQTVYGYTQWYEPGHLGVLEKKRTMARKMHICQQLQFTVTTYNYEMRANILFRDRKD